MLTVKSDDVNGRTKMYKNIVDGSHQILQNPGTCWIFQRIAERNPFTGYQHRAGRRVIRFMRKSLLSGTCKHWDLGESVF
ncbi:hypothetical protein AB6H26_00380 [Providencia hangzhouensis]|uniref:hypothetical protein n=1 Tax=Providencia hangzhouensis TaxID=3031799 RepID=UPI0034DD6B56